MPHTHDVVFQIFIEYSDEALKDIEEVLIHNIDNDAVVATARPKLS